MQRGFGLIFLILFVAIISLVAGGAYYLGQRSTVNSSRSVEVVPSVNPTAESVPAMTSPTPAPAATIRQIPANWLTYKDSVYNFEMKYPSSWTYIDPSKTELGDSSTHVVSFYPLKNFMGVPPLSIYILNNQTNINDYVYKVLIPNNSVNTGITAEPLSIGNLQGILVSNLPGANQGGSEFEFIHNNLFFSIYVEGVFKDNNEQFLDILSTIKFN